MSAIADSMMFLSLTVHVATALVFFTVATFITAVSCRLCPEFIFVPFMFDCKETIKGAIGDRTDTDIVACVALLPSVPVMTKSTCPAAPPALGCVDSVSVLLLVAENPNIPAHVTLK